MANADPRKGDGEETAEESGSWLDWRKSPERIRIVTRYRMLLVGSALCLYSGMILWILADPPVSTGTTVAAASLAGVGFLGVMGAFYFQQMARAKFFERREQEAREGVDEAIGELRDVTDLPALLRINRRQMEQYEALTRRQANSSYRLSQGALAVGLAVLVGGAIAALTTPEASSKAVVGALTAIGSGLAGFIGNTYLRVYERTLVQLNYYFQQPLVTSYVLTAERLADKIQGRPRDEAQQQIITEILATLGPSSPDGNNNSRLPKPDGKRGLFERVLGVNRTARTG